MALNLTAVGQRLDAGERTWNSTDAILYALGVGAGQDPLTEMEFTTENTDGLEQRVLPSFGVMLTPRDRPVVLGDFPRSSVLHAGQELTLHRELPVAGTARTTSTILGFHDKGDDALAVVESEMADATTGEPLATARRTMFIRGEGGFGGGRVPTDPWEPPTPPADYTISYPTRTDQALLYRLSGDRNPLHSDPASAKKSGFGRPILHGLCSFGFAGRALLHVLCDGDPARFCGMSVRFAKPVVPGEELTVEMWEDGAGCRFRARVGDRLVLDRGTFSRKAP
ncbi:MaoC/PaaZ C-terminal domain-containing protein [Streptomyces sp. NPDC055078]